MISRITGAWSAVIVACAFLSASNVEARTCEVLFDSRAVLKESNDVIENLKLKTSIDSKTKQTRVQGFVKIAEGRELYVDFLRPEAGKPIVVLLNGLTYRTGVWDANVRELRGNGLGILRFDPIGMGETMKKYGIPRDNIEIVDQVKDFALLLDRMGIQDPIHVVGLSYGGGMGIIFGALYPHRVASLILEAPFTGPLPAVEKDIQSKIAVTRAMFPFNPATDAELYAFFLRQTVYGQYPLTEPIVLEHPYKLENVYRLTLGTKSFRAGEYVDRLPKGKVHLMVAEKDQYIPAVVLDGFWNSIPEKARASRLFVENSEHKIPEAFPHFSAEWIKLIIAADSRIQQGDTWSGGTWDGGVSSGATKIVIK